MSFDFSNWKALVPKETVDLFVQFPAPWCIAGGWAIDLYMGKTTRSHEDIDLLVFRKDQLLLQELLKPKELYVVDPPGQLRLWEKGEILAPPLYNIWCRNDQDAAWCIQLMLQDVHDQEWTFRRDNSLKGPLEKLICTSREGWPILSPEIQLLYKAKTIRKKDQHDFDRVLPFLSSNQKNWLRNALKKAYSKSHIWINQLF